MGSKTPYADSCTYARVRAARHGRRALELVDISRAMPHDGPDAWLTDRVDKRIIEEVRAAVRYARLFEEREIDELARAVGAFAAGENWR